MNTKAKLRRWSIDPNADHNSMVDTNAYGRELTDEEISRRVHRGFVGGLWDEIGALQLAYLREKGLQPEHHLLDVGCGCLRGGLHLVRYLDAARYCGQDINSSLLKAGKFELKNAKLSEKLTQLAQSDLFDFAVFERKFDYLLAVSLFTHLPLNDIAVCLQNAAAVMKPESRFFATFFIAPTAVHTQAITHQPGGITTSYHCDPFHYARADIESIATLCGLQVMTIEGWNHPRAQMMVEFRRRDSI